MNFSAMEYHKNEEETRLTILKIGKFTVFEIIIPNNSRTIGEPGQ